MSTIEKILVPVDYSPVSVRSYEYAIRLASELSASVHLLHCLPSAGAVAAQGNIVFDFSAGIQLEEDRRLDEFMTTVLKGVQSDLKAVPEVTCSTTSYGLGEAIVYQSEEKGVDLIVAGTHGITDGWDRLFGTNAAFLAAKAKSPILILPPGTSFTAPESICVATSLKEEDRKWGVYVADIFRPFRPSINFLHVCHPTEGQSDEAIDLFRRVFEQPYDGLEASFTSVYDEDVTDGLFGYLESSQHDMLVMMKTRRSWWNRLFEQSETKESAGKTSLPLLILG
ncbi:hypothetical protein FUA23_21155 [Neolewinella aurantiaca]|uniref:UspA domain-containing protein n=1 Tax=Neolewinella aurantiaca TaxID=2602767 RepID=A0A5C7FJ39_9BACT|nr:universal stress protein [Neolewinella aurantiaca]TXF84369.1 hypothetical protein FUA23_21155 [Neolewinella aurantiaca]